MREAKVGVPILKRYLPQYQTSRLIDELKEHDRMRLIQEREARRWTALCALRGTESSSSTKSKDRTSSDTSVVCRTRESVSSD